MQSSPPILDFRGGHGWASRLPSRLGTTALWAAVLFLMGPGLGLSAVGLGLALPLFARLVLPRTREVGFAVASGREELMELSASQDPQRQELAEAFSLGELDLFRARHSQICTVHHSEAGEIVGFSLPLAPMACPIGERDAHPVG